MWLSGVRGRSTFRNESFLPLTLLRQAETSVNAWRLIVTYLGVAYTSRRSRVEFVLGCCGRTRRWSIRWRALAGSV
jgi:hypothetical protein